MVADQPCRERVPQPVRGLLDAGGRHHLRHELSDRPDHSCWPVREIQSGPRSRAGAVGWPWRSVSHARSAARAVRFERDDAAAVALAVADDELAGALRQTHVADVQIGELADPQPGAQQQLHDRPIAS